MDKWQKRQAEALAEEEGTSLEAAARKVLGTTPARKVPTSKQDDGSKESGKGQTPAA
ncbi:MULTISPECIES: hypothetical protein [Terrabacteria group]|uniref:hypothetical protein n=1 Tax=Actinomycetes TaxID=1760 RepID=UPI0035DCE0D3